MKRIKVLGIGSPFGDDQAGWRVAAALKQQLALHVCIAPFVLIESHDRPGARLIELINGFDTIFIIDAVKSGNNVGTIHRFEQDVLLDSKQRFSTHDISIQQALQLANALNELPANLLFYGIEIDAIALADTLSPHVEQAIEKVTSQLLNEILIIYGE